MRRAWLVPALCMGIAGFMAVTARQVANQRTVQVKRPLASWNEGRARQSIIAFVARVTAVGSPDFVPVPERIAVFDNDGTLWTEQPVYVQLAFVIDRIRALAPRHPEWQRQQPFRAVLEGDPKAIAAADGLQALARLMAETHAGMTTAEFEETVTAWIDTAQHPRFHRRYTELVYQPMLELLAYMRENGFTTYVVSGGGIEFMRPWADDVYGVSMPQIVGSSGKLKYELRNGAPVLLKLPEIDFVDDGAGKPAGIQKFIGRRPIAAFGNSDGDLEMLQWATVGQDHPTFGLIVHHTDAEREYAYDRDSYVGKLDKALVEARRRGWVLVDMKSDWKIIFPYQMSAAESR